MAGQGRVRSSLPAASIQPVRNRSASKSIMPEPQMPRGLDVADGRIRASAGGGIDRDLLDGADGGAHAAFDAAALERRAGRAGTGHEEIAVADHDLAVGADVDEEVDVLGVGRPGRCRGARR